MSLRLYADVHVPSAVVAGLKRHNVDIITSQDDRTTGLSDPELLNRATELQRVLVTQDVDFLIEAATRQRRGTEFAGIIYAHQMRVTVGAFVRDLVALNEIASADSLRNRVIHLPLRD